MHFRQQVAQGNADEGAGGKGQRGGHQVLAIASQQVDAMEKQQRPQRTQQGKQHVTGGARPIAPAPGRHQRGDGHGVQWLVQEDGQEYTQPHQAGRAVCQLTAHGRTQGHAIDQGMHAQAEGQADPAHPVGGCGVRVLVGTRFVFVLVLFLGTEIVLVKMEHAQQQQHGYQAQHQPLHRRIGGTGPTQHGNAVGQQVIKRDPEHQSGHQAHGNLGTSVGHLHPVGQQATHQRATGNGDAVQYQQERGCQVHGSISADRRAGDYPIVAPGL